MAKNGKNDENGKKFNGDLKRNSLDLIFNYNSVQLNNLLKNLLKTLNGRGKQELQSC